MADESMECSAKEVIQSLSRNLNSLAEENRATRKRALEGILKETVRRKPRLKSEVLQEVIREILKPCLLIVSDPVEKCRELALTFLSEGMASVSDAPEFLSYIIPVFVQRLGQQDIVEQSEEIRLTAVVFLSELIATTKKNMSAYVDDMVKILQRTIVDPYPEVKKESCKCASLLAKTIPANFHMQSESLIKPLLMTIAHQHSKVRVAAVEAIGDVIQYGNGKSVDDVVSHLAQRTFDQAPTVRSAVTKVVGHWLLDLMDRYSFHHKLIPLLLTGMTDEVPDIRTLADGLWHDVGLKYEGENENDLKDQQDFMKPDSDHYPKDVERPNLGCRTLVYRNFSKIINGLLRDLGDWVAETRIKCAKLLYILIINDEENVTQHMEKVLTGLYKACADEEREVVEYVVKSAELLGYFVSPEVWVKMTLQSVKTSQSFNTVMVLSAIIRGSDRQRLKPYLEDISNVISYPAIRTLADGAMQTQMLKCIESLLHAMADDCEVIGYELFLTLISVMALHRTDGIKDEAIKILDDCAKVLSLESKQNLYNKYTKKLVNSLQEDYVAWTSHSVDRLIFDSLILESGPVVGEILEDIVPMLVANLKPEKDPEVRLKMFSLLSKLMMNSPVTVDSQQKFGDFVVTIVRDMIIPNCVWKAGRVASAVRTTAVSCLWALLSSTVLTKERLVEVQEDVLTQLRSVIEDDNKQTRLVACRIMTKVFNLAGNSLDHDRLHNMYPDLLKRMDDSSDDIRVAVAITFQAYFDCFEDDYNVSLYRAHLEALYKGLLVHLDDPEPRIQEAVLESLKKSASLSPSMLLDEIEAVRLKHRNTKYLDMLSEFIKTLPKED